MSLHHNEIVSLLLAISVMLLSGKLMGELARAVKLPAVVGEIMAGILLGPTILGMISPDIFQNLFPQVGNSAIALDGMVKIAVILLLFIAGLEVELHIVWQRGREAIFISLLGIIVPFAIGFATVWFFPDFFQVADKQSKIIYSLFLGTALSITALPVIARILMDINLFKTKFGTVVISAAMINDLAGWLIFSVVLSMMEKGGSFNLGYTIMMTLGFTVLMLSLGRYLIDKALPWVKKNFIWPGGVLSLSLSLCFACAAFTEAIGIHAIFGAFIVGVALGDSAHLTDRAKEIIHQFINNVFAPLFFVSIGLKINFIENFDLPLVLLILFIACVGKIVGCGIAARLAGFEKREALAVGIGMNARGAMEIILGLIALEVGLINDKMFVALTIMALVTSIISGPLMKRFVNPANG